MGSHMSHKCSSDIDCDNGVNSSLNDVRVYKSNDRCNVKFHQRIHMIDGWPARCAVSMILEKDQLPIKMIKMSCHGKDQGWGNTGHSKVVLAVHRSSSDTTEETNTPVWATKTVSVLLHTAAFYELCLNHETDPEFFAGLRAGDSLGLWAVSAPYPGFEASITTATLAITITNNWARRRNALMFLYLIGFLQLQSEYSRVISDHTKDKSGNVRDKRDEQLQIHHPATYAVCVNNDLCREIITFL